MVSNKLTVLAASAALFESALGFNSHRHLHKKAIDKRAMETDWVTEWVTVWVTPGQGDAIPASCTGSASSAAAAPASGLTTTQVAYNNNVPTTTSTTVIVVPTTTSSVKVANVAANNANNQPKTTLSTFIKPVPAVSKPAVAVKDTTIQAPVQAPSSTSVYVAPTTAVAAPAPVTTTKAAVKAQSTGSSSSVSGTGISRKRGIAFNDVNLANAFHSQCENCGWAYNWGDNSGGLDSSVPFIPTLWGPSHASSWETNANSAISAGSKVLFSFNEPDMPNQATMSPADAAKYHVQYMNPFQGKALIAAPSVSNSGSDGEGLSYLAQWIEACEGLEEQCHYDFCNIHWYSQAQYSDTLFTQIEKAHETCGGKPIWLTEFAPTDTDPNTINSFMQEVIPKLEAIDYLEGYSYFMVATGNLMNDANTLSTYGATYADASA